MAIREKELGGIRENIIENNGGICAYHRSIRKKWIIIAGMAVAVLFFMIISVNAGSTAMSPLDVLKTVVGAGDERGFIVVWMLRMPRVIGAVTAGAGLAVFDLCIKLSLSHTHPHTHTHTH